MSQCTGGGRVEKGGGGRREKEDFRRDKGRKG